MTEAGLTLHPEKTRTVDMNTAESHFDFLSYRFKRSRRGKVMRFGSAQKHAQAARIHQTPDAADRRQEHGSHRCGHQPVACQLLWLLQTRQGQRTWAKPKSQKSSVSDMKQTTNWRAGCGRSASPVQSGAKQCPVPTSIKWHHLAALGYERFPPSRIPAFQPLVLNPVVIDLLSDRDPTSLRPPTASTQTAGCRRGGSSRLRSGCRCGV